MRTRGCTTSGCGSRTRRRSWNGCTRWVCTRKRRSTRPTITSSPRIPRQASCTALGSSSSRRRVGPEWRPGSPAVSGTTEDLALTASAYTIAGALVGAGVGEPSPWAFEARVAAAANAGYRSIGLFESDYSAMIAAGAEDDPLREVLDRHGLVVAEVGFFLDWAHDDELASRSTAMRETLIHMAEAFRPHHISLGEVRGPEHLPPLDVVAERFGAVSDRVAPYGVDALLEFLPWSGIPDVATSSE